MNNLKNTYEKLINTTLILKIKQNIQYKINIPYILVR
jgi:hypothetical protein